MTTSGRSPAVLGISVLAIIIGAAALAVSMTSQGPAGPQGAAGPQGVPGPAGAGLTPKTQKMTIALGEGETIEEVAGEDKLVGEFHRWEPPVLVVKKGDTVELTVVNPRRMAHSLVIQGYGVDTGRLPGRVEQPDLAQRTVVKTFVADKAGVFTFVCGVPFDQGKSDCDLDHVRMVGHLIVLEP